MADRRMPELLFLVWDLANQISSDPSSEMVNKIILHAQHILWAQAELFCLPPVALFTKKCAFPQVKKRPFMPWAKENKKETDKKIPFSLFIWGGSWRLWKPFCVLFLNWFPFPWPPEGGQVSRAKFLTGRRASGDRETNPKTNCFPTTPTPTSQYSRSLSHITKINYNMGGKKYVFFML